MELDTIITGDSAEVLKTFPDACIDLTVTSPPYDNLRTYNGFTFDFETVKPDDAAIKRLTLSQSSEMKTADNIWYIPTGYMVGSKDIESFQHPATFPEALARDHILSWSNEGDTVLDCFCGSGTTPKMAKLLNRHYIGIDTSAEYVALANERLAQLERGLTPLAPDSSKAAVLSLPESVKVENALPAVSG